MVSAGGTREPLDPVRFLGNRSSGRQGYALAEAAAARGAAVALVSANVALPDPAGVDVVRVGYGRASWRRQSGRPRPTRTPSSWPRPSPTSGPRTRLDAKIKKTATEPDPLELVRNPDVLRSLVAEPVRARAGGGRLRGGDR